MVTPTCHPKASSPTPGHDSLRPNLASILFDRADSPRTAVVEAEPSRALSYADLARSAKKFAVQLRRHGLQPQDRVALLLPTSIEFAVAFFGATAAATVIVPLDIFAKRADLMSIL